MLDKDGNVLEHCTKATCEDIPALISQAIHVLVAYDMLKLFNDRAFTNDGHR